MDECHADKPGNGNLHSVKLKRLGIDTYQAPVIYMRADCAICLSEGFEAHSRLKVNLRDRSIVATLNVVHDSLVRFGEAGLSESAWRLLKAEAGDFATVSHAPQLESLRHLRAKIYDNVLDETAAREVIDDITAGAYSDVHLAAFIAACCGGRLNADEIAALTKAMVASGKKLSWDVFPVMDKHCVGGLPGNRTTPVVVAIGAALGLTLPKTSSRAITSPAGTADVMETMTPVTLDVPAMRQVVEREGACLAWGGSARLSPADDILIRVEKTLDVDSDGQLIASVLSKKIAAGSTHVLIDIPVGPTAKLRSAGAAQRLAGLMEQIALRLGVTVKCVQTDGAQPVGRGAGPALEAKDVLAVLRGQPDAPQDLANRAVHLAGCLLEMSGSFAPGAGAAAARAALADGRAWRKFLAICEAQGGFREPPEAKHRLEHPAPYGGTVKSIDNRRLARLAKFAGAPRAPAAGLVLGVKLGQKVSAGEPLFTLHADAKGELAYAMEYFHSHSGMIGIERET